MKTDDKPSLEKKGAAEEPPQEQLTLLGGAPAHSSHLGARLRGYFLTGLIVVGPMAITLYVVWWFINLVDAWVKPLHPATPICPKHIFPSTCRVSASSSAYSV